MTTTRKQHSPQFKARVTIEAIRGEKTLSQLGSHFKVHPMQIAKWRKAALEQMPELCRYRVLLSLSPSRVLRVRPSTKSSGICSNAALRHFAICIG